MASISKLRFASYSATELRELYEKHANLFDELANEAIKEACVGKSPEQTLKLQRLQWIIDTQLRKAKTPLGRMQIMESIFYSQVFGDDGNLVRLRSGCAELIRAIKGSDHGSSNKPKLCLVRK